MKRFLGFMLALVLVSGLAVSPACAAERFVFSNNGYPVKLRSTPDASDESNVITKIMRGTCVEVQYVTDSGKWACVYIPGEDLDGFMMTQFLTADRAKAEASMDIQPRTAPPSAASGTSAASNDVLNALNVQFRSMVYVAPYTAYVVPNHASQRINMRWAPSTAAMVMDTYARGDILTVLAEGASWAQVLDESTGRIGFVSRSFLSR